MWRIISQALLGGLSLAASAAQAQPCPVELSRVSEAWSQAASALPEAKLGGDCGHIVIAGDGGEGATLTFVTQAGRRAARELAHPDELAPALDALLERGPIVNEPPLAQLDSPGGIPPAEPAPLERRELGPSQREARAPDASGAEVVLALQTGARHGASLLSPMLLGSASLAIECWELGVVAAYEAKYFDLEARLPRAQPTGALGLGVGAGRREPVGGATLLTGVRTMLATHTQREIEVIAPSDGPATRGTDALEWRFGGYLGAVAPSAGSLRFRAELGADLVGWGRSTASPPEWAISGLVGVELGER